MNPSVKNVDLEYTMTSVFPFFLKLINSNLKKNTLKYFLINLRISWHYYHHHHHHHPKLRIAKKIYQVLDLKLNLSGR